MNPFENFLTSVIKNKDLHCKWLNTLSYLENCGARKIAACEHPIHVKEEMLKHAAEEFRHALHLKRQIKKITENQYNSYEKNSLLGGYSSLHYLDKLNLLVCRYLKIQGIDRLQVKAYAYLLVTYAIELRAGELYPLYHQLLQKNNSRVTVNSILLEEKEHLREMEMALDAIESGITHAAYVVEIENSLFNQWQRSLISSV